MEESSKSSGGFPTAAAKFLDRHQPAGQSQRAKFDRNGLLGERRRRRNHDKIQPLLGVGVSPDSLKTPKDQGTLLFLSSGCSVPAQWGKNMGWRRFLGAISWSGHASEVREAARVEGG